MKTAFIIYMRGVGLYALMSLPLVLIPRVYFTSMMFVLTYGWIACCLFTLLYCVLDRFSLGFLPKTFGLFVAVAIGTGCAYHAIEITGVEDNVWESVFVIFPFIAMISGWISICISKEEIRNSIYDYE